MDETGCWNDHVILRSYAPRSGPGASVRSTPTTSRDTLVATLCADGSKLPPFYIQHRRQRTRNRVVRYFVVIYYLLFVVIVIYHSFVVLYLLGY
jgi:hypothetical protein